jgi:hypothetical protein
LKQAMMGAIANSVDSCIAAATVNPSQSGISMSRMTVSGIRAEGACAAGHPPSRTSVLKPSSAKTAKSPSACAVVIDDRNATGEVMLGNDRTLYKPEGREEYSGSGRVPDSYKAVNNARLDEIFVMS